MKFDLLFEPPWMNAAGTLGYTPEAHPPVDLERLGAFVTNPVSRQRRTLAHAAQFRAYPGGFLLHTGYPNPGFTRVLRQYAAAWERLARPVIVHLLAENPDELAEMIQKLEGRRGVGGVEIGIAPDSSPQAAAALVRAAAGELPVIVRVPLEGAAQMAASIAAAAEGQVLAFSLGAPRGALPVAGGVQRGRLYGPGVFPLALAGVQALVKLGLPVIGAGGIYSAAEGQAMLDAGAVAVQVDTVLWRGGF